MLKGKPRKEKKKIKKNIADFYMQLKKQGILEKLDYLYIDSFSSEPLKFHLINWLDPNAA